MSWKSTFADFSAARTRTGGKTIYSLRRVTRQVIMLPTTSIDSNFRRGEPFILIFWFGSKTSMKLMLPNSLVLYRGTTLTRHMYDLQKSQSSALPLRQAPNEVLTENGESYLTRTDKGYNLRAYIPALTGSLQCSMDAQCSDGKAMLLKYVTSYVAKCHDAVKTQELYSQDLGAYQAATSFLKNMHPL